MEFGDPEMETESIEFVGLLSMWSICIWLQWLIGGIFFIVLWLLISLTHKMCLKPLVSRLSELLRVEVKMANDYIGEKVEKYVAELPEGWVLLLENVKFYKEDEKNDLEFAKKLASLVDAYMNYAFGTTYKAHA